MTAEHKLGAAFRRLGSLLNAKAVRAEDESRLLLRPEDGAMVQRAAEIEAEARGLAKQLGV